MEVRNGNPEHLPKREKLTVGAETYRVGTEWSVEGSQDLPVAQVRWAPTLECLFRPFQGKTVRATCRSAEDLQDGTPKPQYFGQ